MDFYKILEKIMNEKNMTIPDVSRATGISDSTIRSVISRKTKSASLDVAFKLAKGLDVSLEQLNGDFKVESTELNFYLDTSEMVFVEKYRTLDNYGRKNMGILLNMELERYQHFKKQVHPLPDTVNEDPDDYGDNVVLMPTLIQKICAGTGSIGDDLQIEEVPYPAISVPHGAKYAATISGDSMEPKYSDGDVIFFDDNPYPELGDIVVMNINEENYIKKYTKIGFEALNQKYDTIVPGEDDHVAVYGKVLGKL